MKVRSCFTIEKNVSLMSLTQSLCDPVKTVFSDGEQNDYMHVCVWYHLEKSMSDWDVFYIALESGNAHRAYGEIQVFNTPR